MHASIHKLRGVALVPVLAAAAAFCLPAGAADLPNNGVPGVDMNVSGRDQGGPANNGVPGVDVSVSSQDRGSAHENGIPGVDADVSASNSGTGERNGVPGVDMDIAGQDRAGNGTRAMGAAGSTANGKHRAPRQDRN